jgi:hypothetical protein
MPTDEPSNATQTAGTRRSSFVHWALLLTFVAVFTLQPEIGFEQSKEFSPLERQIYEDMQNHWEENFIEFKNRARPVVIDYLERATEVTGVTFIDLTDIFGDIEGDGYTYYCHLTRTGNRVLAEYPGARILPLVENGWARPKERPNALASGSL